MIRRNFIAGAAAATVMSRGYAVGMITSGGAVTPPDPNPVDPPLAGDVGLPNFDASKDVWEGALWTDAGWLGAPTGIAGLRGPGPNTYGVQAENLFEIFPDRNFPGSSVAKDPEEFQVPGVKPEHRFGLYGPGHTHPVATELNIPAHPNPKYDKVIVNLWYGRDNGGPPDHNVKMPSNSKYHPGANMDPHAMNGVHSEPKGARDRNGNRIPFATPGKKWVYGLGVWMAPDFPVMTGQDSHCTFFQEHGPVTKASPTGSKPTINVGLFNTNKVRFQCRLNKPAAGGRWTTVSDIRADDPVPWVRSQWLILVWEVYYTTSSNGFVRAWRMDGSRPNFRLVDLGGKLSAFQTLNESGSDARKNGMYCDDYARGHYKICATNVVMGTGLKPVIQELLGRRPVKI